MTLLQEELCEGSSAGEMEHLPETWGIELNIVSLGGSVTGQRCMCWAVAQVVQAHPPCCRSCWGCKITELERERISQT